MSKALPVSHWEKSLSTAKSEFPHHFDKHTLKAFIEQQHFPASYLPYCQSKAKLKYSPIECASIDAISSRYSPMQRSAKAKWHIKNLGTLMSVLETEGEMINLKFCQQVMYNPVSYRLENNTTRTATFPKTANRTTTQTEPRSQWDPMTSSHGFKASGMG